MTEGPGLRLGIDASNLLAGGGVTHLVELLRAADPPAHGFNRVTVWGAGRTLDRLESRPWLHRVRPRMLDGPLPVRALWKSAAFDRLARRNADLLLVPGGSYWGRFRPYVAMSRNLLPFDARARAGYGRTVRGLKMMALREVQTRTFRFAAGILFLTRTAQETVLAHTAPLPGRIALVPHGVADRFRRPPRPQKPISAYSMDTPFRWLYVSAVEPYKHQVEVVEAVARLRASGLPVRLELVGPAWGPSLGKLQDALKRSDPSGEFVRYHGATPYEELDALYRAADGFVFASSCENMPNILLEAMAAGLPIACSERSVMPEVLGDGGVLFDPLRPESIASAMRDLVESPEERARRAGLAYDRARAFSWESCAERTFQFLSDLARYVRDPRSVTASTTAP